MNSRNVIQGGSNCTRDEGRPLGLGLQGQGSNRQLLLLLNGLGSERVWKKGGFIRQVFTGETNELESLSRCRKDRCVIETGLLYQARDEVWGIPDLPPKW